MRTLKRLIKLALVLLLAFASARLHGAVMLDLSLEKHRNFELIRIELDRYVEPVTTYISTDNCWILEFYGLDGPARLDASSTYGGLVRLAWSERVSLNPPVQRVVIYLKPDSRMKVRTAPDGLELVITGSNEPQTRVRRDPRSEALIPPVKEQSSIRLDIAKASAETLIRKLAGEISLNIRFRDPPRHKVSIKTEVSCPMEAVKIVAEAAGLKMSIEKGMVWLSAPDNPAFLFPSDGLVSGTELAGLTLKQVLTKLRGGKLESSLIELFPKDHLDSTLDKIVLTTTPRDWAFKLLKAHGII